MSKPNVTRVQSATEWTASVHTSTHVHTAIALFKKHFFLDAPFAPVAMALEQWKQGFGSKTWQSHLVSRMTNSKNGRAKKATLAAFCEKGPKIRDAFSGCFLDSPEIDTVKNRQFASVKTTFLWFKIFRFWKKWMTTSAVVNPAG